MLLTFPMPEGIILVHSYEAHKRELRKLWFADHVAKAIDDFVLSCIYLSTSWSSEDEWLLIGEGLE